MNSLPQFRTYGEVDLDAVLNLCAAEGWATYSEDRARAHRVFTAPGVVSIVATVDDDVVAFAYFQTDGAIQAHLSLLVTDERSRRTGVARALLTYGFPLLGATRIDLITDNAGDFYRRLTHKEHLGFRLYPATQ